MAHIGAMKQIDHGVVIIPGELPGWSRKDAISVRSKK